jgi:pimeloyl-ACP methyl ester carboxylesterase
VSKAKINGIDIHYQEYGEGEAMVFAHGAGGNLLSWWQQIPFFSQHYRCITFDHRGFGHSLDEPEGPGGDAFVDDLKGLLDHLEVDAAHLVAQSMGGRTMLGVALAHPKRTRSLVMADTIGGFAEQAVLDLASEWRRTHTSSTELAFRAYATNFRTRRPDLANLYVQISRTNPPRPTPSGRPSGGPVAQDLGAMKIPTLFIVGEEDEMAPPHVIEAAAKYIPGARVTRVPEAGHSVYFEKPDVFNFEVFRFLQSLEPTG